MDKHALRPILLGHRLAEGFDARAGKIVSVSRLGISDIWDRHAQPVLRDTTDRPRGVWIVLLQPPKGDPVCLEGADWEDVRATLAAETGVTPQPGGDVAHWEAAVQAKNPGTKATVLHTPTSDRRF